MFKSTCWMEFIRQLRQSSPASTTSLETTKDSRPNRAMEKDRDKKTPRAKNRTRGDALYRETVQEFCQRKVG